MPTIVDMRPPTNTFRHATLIVIWLVVCLVGLGCGLKEAKDFVDTYCDYVL